MVETAAAKLIAATPGLADRPLAEAELRTHLESLHAESFGWALCCCGGRRHEAEDVLHLAYLKVLGRKALFHGRSGFKTWLFSVIRLTAAGERRKEVFRRLRLAEFWSRADAAIPQPDAERLVAQRDSAEQVRDALMSLPGRQRQVIHLVYYHELTVGEAAKVMGVGIGSARRHYDRAKRKLRRCLEARRSP